MAEQILLLHLIYNAKVIIMSGSVVGDDLKKEETREVTSSFISRHCYMYVYM